MTEVCTRREPYSHESNVFEPEQIIQLVKDKDSLAAAEAKQVLISHIFKKYIQTGIYISFCQGLHPNMYYYLILSRITFKQVFLLTLSRITSKQVFISHILKDYIQTGILTHTVKDNIQTGIYISYCQGLHPNRYL